MSKLAELFDSELKVVNIGCDGFKAGLCAQGIENIGVDWRTPCGGDAKLIRAVKTIREKNKIDFANEEALSKIKSARPNLAGIGRAFGEITGFHEKLILHPGPPLEWKDMPGILQEAVMGALIYEGLALNEKAAAELAASGEIEFAPSQNYKSVIFGCAVISAGSPVFLIEDENANCKTYAPLYPARGFSEEHIQKLFWVKDALAPCLKDAIKEKINLLNILQEAVNMNDDLCVRFKAASALFAKTFALSLADINYPRETAKKILEFIFTDKDFFKNLCLGAAKEILRSAEGVSDSSIITSVGSNGAEFGIKVSAFKDIWFKSPRPAVLKEVYSQNFGAQDAACYIGDNAAQSASSACAHLGSPAVNKYMDIEPDCAGGFSQELYDISEGENTGFTAPYFNFKPASCAWDAVKITELANAPTVSCAVMHRRADIGVIGAQLIRPKTEAFEKAVLKLSE